MYNFGLIRMEYQMRTFKLSLIICFILFFIQSSTAQIIQKIIKDFVLIDTDQGIGRIQDVVNIYRFNGQTYQLIGRVRLLKFQQGKAAGKIIFTEPGRIVKIGDRVYSIEGKSEGYQKDSVAEWIQETTRAERSKLPVNDNRVGIHIGEFLPAAHFQALYNPSFSLGLWIKLAQLKRHSFYMQFTYPFLQKSVDSESNPTFFILSLANRIRVGDFIHYELGGGLYHYNISAITSSPIPSKSNAGFFAGLSVDFPTSMGFTLSPSIRYHTFHREEVWIEFMIGGLNVYFSLF
jgi:hypothetical protein